MNLRKKAVLALSLASAMTVSGAGAATVWADQTKVVTAEGPIAIDEKHFPDQRFRGYIAENFDKNKDGVLSEEERKAVTGLNMESMTIFSLQGVEYFTELTVLDCAYNPIEKLDIRALTKLKVIDCGASLLSDLDVSNCPDLENLICDFCALEKIDLSKNTKLKYLVLSADKLTELDISHNPDLEFIGIEDNPIDLLDISNQTKIRQLFINGTFICDLDLSKLTELFELDVSGCMLEKLDVSHCPKLQYLLADDCGLSELDVTHNPLLRRLVCTSNDLTGIDISQNPKLDNLDCGYNDIEKLDLSHNPDLMYLYCGNNELENIDLSPIPKLVSLDVSRNDLTKLDLSYSRDLANLFCYENKLTELDVTKNPFLSILSCDRNSLSELNLSKNKHLASLNCEENQLSKLDLSSCHKIRELYCSYNYISELDLSKNKILDTVYCYNNQISNISLGEKPKLVMLQCDNNLLSELDVSQCEKMYYLTVAGNQLEKLDITNLSYIRKGVEKEGFKHEYGVFDCLFEDLDQEIYEGRLCFDDTVELIPAYVTPVPKKGKEPTPTPEPTPEPEKETGVAGFVERLYTVALGRPSDKNGKKYWVDEINAGKKSGADCARYFLLGAEFENRKMDNGQFVETLYRTFFDRDSESEGKKYWVGRLDKKEITRKDVISGFIDSTEWCNVCADFGVRSGAPSAKAERPSAKAKEFASRLYTACLGREADQGGLLYWALALTNLERTGAGAALEFFTSPEFINLNTSNEEFVTRVYRTFMGREPEKAGFDYWVGELEKGADRISVMAGFAQSPEFTELCRSYGIERGAI